MDVKSNNINLKSDINNVNLSGHEPNDKQMNNKSLIKNFNNSDTTTTANVKANNLAAINNNKSMFSKNNNNNNHSSSHHTSASNGHHPDMLGGGQAQKKNGFLSRLKTHFSFRSNASKKNVKNSDENKIGVRASLAEETHNNHKLVDEKNVNLNNKKLKEQNNESAFSQNNKNKDEKSLDFIYIPLKGPPLESGPNDEPDHHQPMQSDTNFYEQNLNLMNTSAGKDQVLVTKPPLPKLPPRIVGSAAKRPAKTSPQRYSHQPGPRVQTVFDTKGSYTDLMSTGLAPVSSCIPGARNLTASQRNFGLIETNLDTDETFVCGKTLSLMELGFAAGQNQKNAAIANAGCPVHQPQSNWRSHKSMEFLLDKENHQFVPENELQRRRPDETKLSEHQLRIQRSLQKLNVPEWYTQNKPQTPVIQPLLRKRNSDVGRRWEGLSSKTTSLSSLGSYRLDESPVLHQSSPSPTPSRIGYSGFSRWSTSQLNASPNASARNSLSRGNLNASNTSYTRIASSITPKTSVRSSFRQPYLGWRSQEKLSQPRTSNERLAATLPPIGANTTDNSEIQTSIKEVTSAIVHFVNDQKSSRSRSTSPLNCWVESSFVDKKPLQNSNILNAAPQQHQLLNNNSNVVKRTENFLIGESTLI